MKLSKGDFNKFVYFWFFPFLAGGCVSTGYLTTHRVIMKINNMNHEKNGSSLKGTTAGMEKIVIAEKEVFNLKAPYGNSKDEFSLIEKPNRQKIEKSSTPKAKEANRELSTVTFKAKPNQSTQTKAKEVSKLTQDNSESKILSIPKPNASKLGMGRKSESEIAREKIFKKLFQSLPQPK